MSNRVVITIRGGVVVDIVSNIEEYGIEYYVKDLDDEMNYRAYESYSPKEANEIAQSIEY